MQRVVVIVLVVAVVVLTLLWVFQRRLIYLPSTTSVPPAEVVIPGARDVVLHTSDGLQLGAWLVPAEQPDRGLTVLVASGNAGDRAARAPLARALAEEGLSVLLFDYRGYGGNPGSPTEHGLAADVRAAQSFLVDNANVSPSRLLYFGESLGAAVVTELAAEHPPAGMVLRSPFVDLTTIGELHYPFLPVPQLLRDKYPLVQHLADVKAPVSVVYGAEDSIVPPGLSSAVAAAAPELLAKVEIPGADHNDPALVHGPRLIAAVVDLANHIDRSS